MSYLKRFYNSAFFFPFLLFLTVFITYGYQLAGMGFYWDDWELVFLDHLKDPRFYWSYFLYARPFWGWLSILMEPILHVDPVRWQLFNIIMRAAIMIGFWWALRMVWPARKIEIGWMCLLLAVYPGFTQHNVALSYIRHFTGLAMYAFSLGLNIWAIKHPKHFWAATIPAMLLSLVQLLTLEYFFGLEILRVFFLFFILSEKYPGFWKRVWETFKQWAPYIVVLILFGIWRFVIYRQISPNPGANDPVQIQRLLASPLQESIRFATLILQDSIFLNLFTWINPIQPDVIDFRARATLFSWALAAVSAAGLCWLFIKGKDFNSGDENRRDAFTWQGLLVGVMGVLLGGVPVWMTGRQSIGGPWADRFSLGPMLGAIILVIVAIEWFARRRLQKTILMGLVFALAMSFQLQNVNKYRLSWQNQKDFYWQLAWRAPEIKDGTAVIGANMPFALVNDLHIGFALNTIYAPELRTIKTPIWFFRAGGMTDELIPDFKPGFPIHYRYLNVTFDGSTSNSLVVFYNNGADCLHIARPEDAEFIDYGNDLGKEVKLSRPELILPNPDRPVIPPAEIFGPEPVHTWCYFYQKADLARQQGDWEEVTRQWKEVEEQGYSPANLVEYIPFVQGLAFTGDWEKAYQISIKAGKDSEGMSATYCRLWNNLAGNTTASPEREQIHDKLKAELECAINAP